MSLVDSFWASLKKRGIAPALQGTTASLSYQELIQIVETRCAQLEQLNAQRIALALDNGPDWALWDLAISRAQRVCIPIPGFFSQAQQQHVLEDAGVDLIITDQDSLSFAEGFQRISPLFLRCIRHSFPPLPQGTQKITYTSGTTGTPKGVCLDFEAQLSVAKDLWEASQSSQVSRYFCVLPLATLLENIAGIYAPLWGGACTALYPLTETGIQGASGFNLNVFLESLHKTQPNSITVMPQILLGIISAVAQGYALPTSLRFIAVGGARVAPQLLEQAAELHIPVFEGYGLSECASVVCLNTPEANRIGSVGKPLSHVQMKLAEDQEVLVQGHLFLGYLGDAEPAAHLWFPTGDLGHFEDGFLVLHGRKKNQFITAFGRNVNPEWVEAELIKYPAIAQAWVYGEALPENLAVLVPRRTDCTDAELHALLVQANTTLPEYARVHRWIRSDQPFSATNGFVTTNGRLKRSALLAHYQSIFDTAVAVSCASISA